MTTNFRIVCDVCNRKVCDFQFTEKGDIVVYCRSCGNTHLIHKQIADFGESGRQLR